LAALSQQAHTATAAGDAARVGEIEAEIDRLAAELWGLTEEEQLEVYGAAVELVKMRLSKAQSVRGRG
jgi:hypothetical protein